MSHVDMHRPIGQHMPRAQARGCVLVISDYQPLNLGHASVLCQHGYVVYTAVTCTDVRRLLAEYEVGEVDLIVFASLVHGWHHREGESRPASIPQVSDADWQTRNMRAVVDCVRERQERLPRVLVASELMDFGWYEITAEALAAEGIRYATYSVNDPLAIVGFAEQCGAHGRTPAETNGAPVPAVSDAD